MGETLIKIRRRRGCAALRRAQQQFGNMSASRRRRAGWPFITRSSLGCSGLFGWRLLNQRGGGASIGDDFLGHPIPREGAEPHSLAVWWHGRPRYSVPDRSAHRQDRLQAVARDGDGVGHGRGQPAGR